MNEALKLGNYLGFNLQTSAPPLKANNHMTKIKTICATLLLYAFCAVGQTNITFDVWMRSMPPNCDIPIPSGTNYTLGTLAWNPKTGQHIHGAGRGLTVIMFPSNAVVSGALLNAQVIGMNPEMLQSNVYVSDLTIDCNYQPGTFTTLNGIGLVGSGNTIERVECINTAAWTRTNYSEAWGIVNGPSKSGDTTGNRIIDCVVSHFHGNGINDMQALGLMAGSGIIRGNSITGDGTNIIYGILPGSHDSLIDGNTTTHVVNGIHIDSSPGLTNSLVINNQFIGVTEAADLQGVPVQNVKFSANMIQLTDVRGTKSDLTAFLLHSGTGYYINLDIAGNMVSVIGTVTPNSRFIWASNARGLTSHGNIFSVALPNLFQFCSGAVSTNNYLFGVEHN